MRKLIWSLATLAAALAVASFVLGMQAKFEDPKNIEPERQTAMTQKKLNDFGERLKRAEERLQLHSNIITAKPEAHVRLYLHAISVFEGVRVAATMANDPGLANKAITAAVEFDPLLADAWVSVETEQMPVQFFEGMLKSAAWAALSQHLNPPTEG